MNKAELDAVLESHKKWLRGDNGGSRADLSRAHLSGADLSGADLSWADLSRADLSRANLSGANLDYSCWPLWCGSKNVTVDKKIALQLIAHICVLVCNDEEVKAAQESMKPFAAQSHRARDLGLL
jgi:uncharacterized protein YjbI with pentapeptide repeats